MNALGLVVNAIVLWNMRYMGVAVGALRADGLTIDEAGLSRFSPNPLYARRRSSGMGCLVLL